MHYLVEESLSRIITLRNMPEELERRIEDMAEVEGTSLAQTAIRLLLRATGLGERAMTRGSGKRYHELDALAGTWSEDDAAEFDRALAEQRTIEPGLWG